jgi:ribosomal protein S6
MRLYEVVYILDPALDQAAVTAKLEKFHALATSQGG